MKMRKRRNRVVRVVSTPWQWWATPDFTLFGDEWVNQKLVFTLHNRKHPQFKRKMK